jgi:hypothetical protein
MNTELEKMIRYATEDGSITDKEREIIIRKAQEMGADIDEVEIMLESELAKHRKVEEVPKPAVQKPKEKVRKCPNCGATVTESMQYCPECGYSFSLQSETSEDIQKRIEHLQEMLENVDKEQRSIWEVGLIPTRKASIISTFTMPTTKEGLLQFLDFAYSNFSCMPNIPANIDIRGAWKGKAQMAYNMLRRYGATDNEVQATLTYYDELFNKEERRLSPTTKLILFGGVFFFIMILFSIIMSILFD